MCLVSINILGVSACNSSHTFRFEHEWYIKSCDWKRGVLLLFCSLRRLALKEGPELYLGTRISVNIDSSWATMHNTLAWISNAYIFFRKYKQSFFFSFFFLYTGIIVSSSLLLIVIFTVSLGRQSYTNRTTHIYTGQFIVFSFLRIA